MRKISGCGGHCPGGAREPAVAQGTGFPSDSLTCKSLWRFCVASIKVRKDRVILESQPLSNTEGTTGLPDPLWEGDKTVGPQGPGERSGEAARTLAARSL